MKQLAALDYIVVCVYFLCIAAVGLRAGRGIKTTSKYFVADRAIPTWAVAFTLMATMISSGSVIGHPATVFGNGMILLLGSSSLIVVLVFVAIYIVPFYRNVVRLSAYEYLGQRFGLTSRVYASLGFVVDRVFDLGVSLVATALALGVMTGWDLGSILLWLGAFTVLYTSIGGIEAVVWTNAVQGVILLGGAFLMLVYLLVAPEAGPPGATLAEAWRGGRFDLGSFELSFESLYHENATQWLIITAYLTNWGRRYIADQHMVQRYLLARTDKEAQKGALWGACSCVPIWILFMLIGACLYGYYELTSHVPAAIADEIVPRFLVSTFPAGLVGLFLAAIMAASMSSVSADLNSVATVLTTDYYVRLRPQSSEKQRLFFGRGSVCVAGALATWVAYLLIPGESTESLLERVVTLLAILSGGVLGLFALGFLTRRATSRGCIAGIIACLTFTAWGIATRANSAGERFVDLGFNFEMHPILIGVFGHFILFGVGYGASLLLGGFCPEGAELERLTIHGRRAAATTAESE